MKIKISESELKSIIKECIVEQSRSFFDYMRSEHPFERLDDKEYDEIYDKMDDRRRWHYNDGKNEYIPVNQNNVHARDIFRHSTPETVNSVVKNSKRQKSVSDLQRSNGEDSEFMNWDTFTSDETGEPIGVNASKMRKAKMYYDMKGMTPEEKNEYIRTHFPGRYTTIQGLAKL